jgi:hypothetical protein
MKTLLLSILIATSICSAPFFSVAQDVSNPAGYMAAISNAHSDMNKKYMAYMSMAAHSNRRRKIEKLRQQVLESITESRYKTIEIPIYKGDNSLRKSSMDYIQMCYNVFNEDYNKIVNMEEIAEQSFDEMQAFILLQEKTDEKLKEAFSKMDEATKAFAAKYDVKLVDSKDALGEKMEVAGKLSHYKNQVYLLFFKCNWQDGNVVKAMNAKKVNDVEQARSALVRYAEEGIKTLDTLKGFEGDKSLAATCKQVLQFYKKTAENDLPKMTDFFLKQENFDKIKKTLDSKAEHSKAEVDAYNKAVNEMNAAVNTFNQLNNQVNNNRNQILKNWSDTESSFTDLHMPHYKA